MILAPQERYGRLKWPIHKYAPKNVVELFELVPGLRRYFQQLDNQARDIEMDVEDPDDDASYRVSKQKVKVYLCEPIQLVQIVKYIVFMYDPDSDLEQEFPGDYRLRKDAAATDAGFMRRKDNGAWLRDVEDILSMRDPIVVKWIIDYLKVRKNQIWKDIVFLEEELEKLYAIRAKHLLEDKVKDDVVEQVELRTGRLEKLYQRFYAEHREIKEKVEEEIYPISPENVFKELKVPREQQWPVQVNDVPEDQRGQSTYNSEPVSGLVAAGAEGEEQDN